MIDEIIYRKYKERKKIEKFNQWKCWCRVPRRFY